MFQCVCPYIVLMSSCTTSCKHHEYCECSLHRQAPRWVPAASVQSCSSLGGVLLSHAEGHLLAELLVSRGWEEKGLVLTGAHSLEGSEDGNTVESCSRKKLLIPHLVVFEESQWLKAVGHMLIYCILVFQTAVVWYVSWH